MNLASVDFVRRHALGVPLLRLRRRRSAPTQRPMRGCDGRLVPAPRLGPWVGLLAMLLVVASGCHPMSTHHRALEEQMRYQRAPQPRELSKVLLPAYTIEAPDILLIEAVKVVPKDPYSIEPLDLLQIQVSGALIEHPISGAYQVGPGGTVDLGPPYNVVKVLDLTLEEAKELIDKYLRDNFLQDPDVTVSLAQPAAKQQIQGEHLVGPDGRVVLGTYGSVRLAGLSVDEAKLTIERHLSQHLTQPEVAVSVFAYNSKVYYVIVEGAGLGDQIVRLPFTGNETVLDAISQIGGLTRTTSKRMWIARPSPDPLDYDQILPVNWQAIVKGARTATNYQLLPGDRLFIAEDKIIAIDTLITKVLAPFERVVGFNLLTAQTIQLMNRFPAGQFTGQNILGQ